MDIIKPIINEFGDRIEYKLCTSIYQWDIVQKYGILNPPTIIINEKIQLNQIDKNSLTKAIQSQL